MDYAWLIAGLALLGAELLTPGGFYLIFFGVGALVVGLITNLGLGVPVWMQVALFSVVSIAALLLFRKPILRYFESKNSTVPVDALVGEIALASESLAPQAHGRVEFRGTSWEAHNAGAHTITVSQRCRIVRVEGLMLVVQGESDHT